MNNSDILIQFHSNNKNYLIINFKENLRNKKWTIYLGNIQNICEKALYQNCSIEIILIDISKCQWIDPLPLLSLGILFRQFKNKIKFIFKIPSQGVSENTDKTLKFLAKEGFFTSIRGLADIVEDKLGKLTSVGKNKIENFQNIKYDLTYSNSTLIPFQIINLYEIEVNYENIDLWIDEELAKIRTKLIGILPEFQLDTLLYKMKIFYGETLHNINKHAYFDKNECIAGIFTRLRYGLQSKSISEEEKISLINSLKNEKTHCPRLENEFVEMNELFIEMFVLDHGIGLNATMKELLPLDYKYPFRESCNLIFIEGKKKLTSSDYTKFGGLYNIGKLFESNYDYLCGKDLNEWVGDFLPFDDRFSYEFIDSENLLSLPQSHSLAWIGRISSNYRNSEKNEWTKWEGSINRHPFMVANLCEEPFFNETFLKYKVFDFRKFVHKIDYDTFKKIQINRVKNVSTKKILVFPQKNLSKTGVWNILENVGEEIDIIENRDIFIVDIPYNESYSYIAALSEPRFKRRKWPLKYNRIILITNNLSVCILERHELDNVYSFKIDYDESFNFFNLPNFNDNSEIQLDSLYFIILWIKQYESILFWNNLKTNNQDSNLFVNTSIKWNKEIPIINGYLNFSQTVANIFHKNIYKQVLFRSKSLFPNSNLKFNNMDIITSNIVDEMNSELYTDFNNQEIAIINTGSVFVSGLNVRDAQFGALNIGTNISLHFFLHPNSKTKVAFLLNWPDPEFIDEIDSKKDDGIYERVGRTHVIAKYGWKYFSMPRYLTNNESFYHRSPKDSYKDWQSPYYRILKIGNYRYNDYYDLFKVDLRRMISMSFEFKEELARYLIEQFFIALGGKTDEDLTEIGKPYFERFQLKKESNLNYYNNVKAIVYPNHGNTSLIIEKIKEHISEKLTKNIYPLTPVKDKCSNSALIISPLIFDTIENKLKNDFGIKNVLFFDDSIVSGRTRKEIKHIMKGLGADDILSLTILDRNRLPFHLPSEKTYRAYWRLDIPRLGTKSKNPLNNALSELYKIESKLINPDLKFRINIIKNSWQGIYLFQDNSQVGINPTQITIRNNKSKKRLGLEKLPPHNQIGGKKNMIEITNSLGLTLYATEVHTITGKDDIALKFCRDKDYELSYGAKIELIGTQLLLFENEHPKEVHFDLLREILYAAYSLKNVNNYSSFALLVLISQDSFYLNKLLNSFIDYLIQNDIRIEDLNDDLKLLLGYYYKTNIDKIDSNILFTQLELYFEETFKLSLETFSELHYELYDSSGVLHDTSLLRLCESYGDNTKLRIENARLSFLRLKGLINDKLSGSHSRSDYKYCITDYINCEDEKQDSIVLKQNIINSLDDCFIKAQSLLNDVVWEETGLPKYQEHNNRITDLVNDVKLKLLSLLRLYHSSITYPIKGQREIERPFEAKCKLLINSLSPEKLREDALRKKQTQHMNESIIIHFTNVNSYYDDSYSNSEYLWIPFDRRMQFQLLDLLHNSVYSVEKINDPWDKQSILKANLWLKVEYKQDFVILRLVNKTFNAPEHISHNYMSKRGHDRIYLYERLGFKYQSTYFDKENNLIEVSISIPIIP